ncbi:hypothetical protein BJ508DRAFT_121222 [Ascobolus immersus RN42]|uniref:Uncharacterized protein n=1 Tax=Ascobolus immersus RN42 TaxID=1160509 RepID=A0A3N4IL52_ASCIM|nr:hypothetical protein BJ508DRAFT_121222 [Ascobolus immersus RN42]
MDQSPTAPFGVGPYVACIANLAAVQTAHLRLSIAGKLNIETEQRVPASWCSRRPSTSLFRACVSGRSKANGPVCPGGANIPLFVDELGRCGIHSGVLTTKRSWKRTACSICCTFSARYERYRETIALHPRDARAPPLEMVLDTDVIGGDRWFVSRFGWVV